MAEPDGISWVAERLQAAGVATVPTGPTGTPGAE